MPVLVHLAREDDAKRMVRRGIRAGRGVYCLPVMESYFVSHQWLRELKRGGARTLVAVHFRLPDEEPVLVGRFDKQHEETTLGRAVRRIRQAPSPLGFELIVPRAVAAKEILAVRAVPQVSGWRYYPEAKGRPPFCTCRSCNRGEIKAGERWRAVEPRRRAPGMPELLRRLRATADPGELQSLLGAVANQWRRDPEALAFLLDHPDPRVLEMLAFALASFRGSRARPMLARLAEHPEEAVRSAARGPLGSL